MKKIVILMIFLLSTATFACENCSEDSIKPWYMGGFLGMSFYPGVSTEKNEQTIMGRFSLGHVLADFDKFQITIDGGVQSGTSMRFLFDKSKVFALGGVPIEVKFNPLVDILPGIRTNVLEDLPLFLWIKGGVAYRQLKIDRDTVNSLRKISPEILTGIGYVINERAALNLEYQYIWGGKPRLAVNPLNETGILKNIPSQQAIMLGFSFNFGGL